MTEAGSTSAGAALFARLRTLGVDYVFCNSGTDFPPIIEGLAEAEATGQVLPKALIIPHEHAAMGMAHGYYFATGQAQAVMLHTNVGLANGVIGAINAATDQVPMLLMSGRTPTVEKDRIGARTVPIGWGQEMRDQTALIRESVKWDYELRFPEQIIPALDRAHAIAMSTPRGPTYLALPREVLCETITDQAPPQPTLRAVLPGPNRTDIAALAALIRTAERPVIFAQRGCGSAEAFATLSAMAQTWAIPVCQYWACALAIGASHPMSVGAAPAPWLTEADLVIVIDSLAPWMPDAHEPGALATVAQMGPDPLYARFPVRNFRADLAIACETADGILALQGALGAPDPAALARIAARRPVIAKRVAAINTSVHQGATVSAGGPITKAYVSHCLGQALADLDATVLSELGAPLAPLGLEHHNAWRQEPHSGGLGWSMPCALGMKLATPDRVIVATMGDGSYMFANPTVCHQIAEALDLPIIVLVLNNGEWGAVRQSVAGLYPDGFAVRANRVPLTSLAPSPDFTLTARASRAHAETITRREDLPGALDRALKIAGQDRRQVLLDIQISG